MMNKLRGADIVAQTLEHLGVTRIFALSGNHIMPIFDALLATDIVIIHVRQEAACVHMADAWGRLTGEVGVALVTGGQGMTNGAAALFTAMSAESPMLLLSGHAGLRELGRGAFQELAQADIARPMCKESWTAASMATLGIDLARGIRLAKEGRPGPVHIALPVDLLEGELPAESVSFPKAEHPLRTAPARSLVADLNRALSDHERPLVLVGPALCGAQGKALASEVERRRCVPVIGMESPRGVNDPGLGSFAEILAQADLLVLVGKPLDFTLRFGDAPAVSPGCDFVVVDADPELVARASRAKGSRLVASGVADPEGILTELSSSAPDVDPSKRAWLDRVKACLTYEPAEWATVISGEGRVHPVQLCRSIATFLKRHAAGTLVCDGGEIGQWPQAVVRHERRLVNGVSGTIGVALPFAIAAQALTPDEPVVAVLGDGTFGFHMAEFDTAVRYDLPIIVIVGNDARWNAEYQIQVRNYGEKRAKHCTLLPSRYDQVASALGGRGVLVTSINQLDAALEEARASRKPTCINVMIDGVAAPTIRRPANS